MCDNKIFLIEIQCFDEVFFDLDAPQHSHKCKRCGASSFPLQNLARLMSAGVVVTSLRLNCNNLMSFEFIVVFMHVFAIVTQIL
jgi:hypothetical protein